MKKIKVVAIIGKSGVGKDFYFNKFKENAADYGINPLISRTTRPKRDYERDGVDYYFVSEEEFTNELVEDKFEEFSVFRGWYYGTHRDDLDPEKINIGVFNPTGIVNLSLRKEIDLYVIHITAEDNTRLIRQLQRGDDPEEVFRRYDTDKKDFENDIFTTKIELMDPNRYCVIDNEHYGDDYEEWNLDKMFSFIFRPGI